MIEKRTWAQMIEKRAWAYLADRWAGANRVNGVYRATVESQMDGSTQGGTTCVGLCASVNALELSNSIRDAMLVKLPPTVPGEFAWPTETLGGMMARLDFCVTMAAEL